MRFGSVVFTLLVCLAFLAAGGPAGFMGSLLLTAILVLTLRDGALWLFLAVSRALAALWRGWRSYRDARVRHQRDIEAIQREMAALSPFTADFDFWALELHSVLNNTPRMAFAFLPEPVGPSAEAGPVAEQVRQSGAVRA